MTEAPMPTPDDTRAEYYRRLADERLDQRVTDLSKKVDQLDTKVDTLTVRLGIIGAIGAVVVILANIIGPVIASFIVQSLNR